MRRLRRGLGRRGVAWLCRRALRRRQVPDVGEAARHLLRREIPIARLAVIGARGLSGIGRRSAWAQLIENPGVDEHRVVAAANDHGLRRSFSGGDAEQQGEG